MDERNLIFANFLSLLSNEFQWNGEAFNRHSNLFEDCGLDSMAMYELLLLLEEQGFDIDEDSLFAWETIGDVYDTCTRQASS